MSAERADKISRKFSTFVNVSADFAAPSYYLFPGIDNEFGFDDLLIAAIGYRTVLTHHFSIGNLGNKEAVSP